MLTLELARYTNFGQDYIEILMSIPGTEGVAESRWEIHDTGMLPSTANDLHAWVSRVIAAACIRSGRQQEVLPL